VPYAFEDLCVVVLSASGVRSLMRGVPSIQDEVPAALTARLSDD